MKTEQGVKKSERQGFLLFFLLMLFSYSSYANGNPNCQFSQDTCVTIFLSPECPICQKYTRRLNEIYERCVYNDIKFIGVVSDKHYNEKDLRDFKLRYGVNYKIELDEKSKHATKWNATTTPEVVLSVGDSIIYRGMIDNWFYAIGRSSNKTTKKYLMDAVESLLNGTPLFIQETKPIGCFIE